MVRRVPITIVLVVLRPRPFPHGWYQANLGIKRTSCQPLPLLKLFHHSRPPPSPIEDERTTTTSTMSCGETWLDAVALSQALVRPPRCKRNGYDAEHCNGG